MPDNVLPVSAGTKPPSSNSSSLEEDFPTLTKSATSSADQTEAPVWFKPVSTPMPVTSTPAPLATPVAAPTTTSTPSSPSQSSEPKPETPVVSATSTTATPPVPPVPPVQNKSLETTSSALPEVKPPTAQNIFSPLGGVAPTTTGSFSVLPTLNPSGFETLEKVVTTQAPKKDDLSTTNIFPDVVPQTQKPKGAFFVVGVITLLFVLVASLFGGVAGIAYGYIHINDSLDSSISDFIQGLPFTPKTAKYLITKTVIAQKSITKESFSANLSVRSKDVKALLNTNTVDIATKGSIDYTDPQNIRLSANAAVSKDFNADVKAQDKKVYFHINKLPASLLTSLNLSEDAVKPLLQDWIYYDATPLNTEVNNVIKSQDGQDPNKEFIQKLQNIFFNDQVISNIQVSNDTLDRTRIQKLHFIANPDTIDYLGTSINTEFNPQASSNQNEKLSDYLSNLVIDVWIENSTYYLRKFEISFTTTNNSPSTPEGQKTTNDFDFSYNLSDIGKDFSVDVPSSSITPEQLFSKIKQLLQSNPSSNPSLLSLPN